MAKTTITIPAAPTIVVVGTPITARATITASMPYDGVSEFNKNPLGAASQNFISWLTINAFDNGDTPANMVSLDTGSAIPPNWTYPSTPSGTSDTITGLTIDGYDGRIYVSIGGEDPRVVTQMELEERLAARDVSAKSVVMIQCVGCRNEDHPYCSRICCSEAIKNSLEIKT